MSAEPTYTETVTQLRGDMREGFAEIKGQLSTLTEAVEAGNRARIAEANDLRADVNDHEARIRALERLRPLTAKTLVQAVLAAVTITSGFFAVLQYVAR